MDEPSVRLKGIRCCKDFFGDGKIENGFFVFFPSKWSQEAPQKIL